MITAPEHLPDDVGALKATLIEIRAELSGAEEQIAHLQVVIEKEHNFYGVSSRFCGSSTAAQ